MNEPYNPLSFFGLVLKASLLSTGGTGNVPSLHSDLTLSRGWVSDTQIAESLAVGQVAPGPNGLWVVSLGYLVGGVPSALLALAAICLPPLLILLVDKAYRRVQNHPFVSGFVRGLSLAVVGVFVVVMGNLLQSSGSLTWRGLLIALVSFGLGATKRVPIAAIIAVSAVVGMVWR